MMERRAILLGGAALIAAQCRDALAQSGGQTGAPSAPQVRDIEAQNALEQDFLAAFANPALRATFRIRLLNSLVALALQNSALDAAPRLIPIRDGVEAALIFTSATRLASVLGPAAARTVMIGRSALELLRGKYVALNYGLAPMLMLEPDDVANFLTIGAGE